MTTADAIFPNAEVILHEEEARFWLDRDESTAPQRAHPPQHRQGAGHHRALPRAHAHGPRRRGDAGRIGDPAGRSHAGPHRLAAAVRQREPADLGRSRPSRQHPDSASRHRAGLRCRSAAGGRDPQAHVRPYRGRQAAGRRRAHGLSGLRLCSRARVRSSASSRTSNRTAGINRARQRKNTTIKNNNTGGRHDHIQTGRVGAPRSARVRLGCVRARRAARPRSGARADRARQVELLLRRRQDRRRRSTAVRSSARCTSST